jgi:hypothetical protein
MRASIDQTVVWPRGLVHSSLCSADRLAVTLGCWKAAAQRRPLVAGPSHREVQTRRRKPAIRRYDEARFSSAPGRTAFGRQRPEAADPSRRSPATRPARLRGGPGSLPMAVCPGRRAVHPGEDRSAAAPRGPWRRFPGWVGIGSAPAGKVAHSVEPQGVVRLPFQQLPAVLCTVFRVVEGGHVPTKHSRQHLQHEVGSH